MSSLPTGIAMDTAILPGLSDPDTPLMSDPQMELTLAMLGLDWRDTTKCHGQEWWIWRTWLTVQMINEPLHSLVS
jgi:hypothetical protein